MLEFRQINKRFGEAAVLRNVSLRVARGRTLGLVGENGAGKSTLMNILGGNLAADSGLMVLDGHAYEPRNPTDATRHRIAFIHQELNLFPNLSIAENLFLTGFPQFGRLPLIRRSGLRRQTVRLLDQVGLHQSPDCLVERLSAGERQLVEIAKALAGDARLIIFDEPTTSLSARETERLFALMSRLRAQGISMIYISHVLGDVQRWCDDLVILRDGEVVGAGPVRDFSIERMITLMVGRSLNQLYPERAGTPGPSPVLSVRGLSQPGIVRDIAFELQRGEVLGIFGLMGAGRSELARILFGLDPHATGTVLLNGVPLGGASPRERIRRGLAFLTENRREEGLCLEAGIAENMTLAALPNYLRRPAPLLDQGRLGAAVRGLRESVRLTPGARDDQPVQTLSGGNQQKVVLAKWLLAQPAVLILDEPTRGIDVGAKFEVYQLIRQLALEGAGILIISSELEELTGLCDRILVMAHGEITDAMARPEFQRERILRAALEENGVRTGAPVSAGVTLQGRDGEGAGSVASGGFQPRPRA